VYLARRASAACPGTLFFGSLSRCERVQPPASFDGIRCSNGGVRWQPTNPIKVAQAVKRAARRVMSLKSGNRNAVLFQRSFHFLCRKPGRVVFHQQFFERRLDTNRENAIHGVHTRNVFEILFA